MATDCQLILAEVSSKLDIQTWAALIVAAVATAYVLMRSKAKARRDPMSRQQHSSPSLAQQRAVERQMSNLLVELSEMARSISAGLDTRAAKLQVLIDEADRRIEQMKSMEMNTPPREGPAASTTMRIVSDSAEAPQAGDARHERVYQLADQGKSAHEIAVMVGKPRGEVELILALRERGRMRG